MNFVFWFAVGFSLVYLSSLILYGIGLRRPYRPKCINRPFVSVVIAIKNEEERVPILLKCLAEQDYPKELYEIIVVDNESEDRTLELLIEASSRIVNLRVYSTKDVHSEYRNKKAAMDLGIAHSKGEIILTTDADCEMGPGWISATAEFFDENVGMVAGFCSFQYGKAPFFKLQALDYLMLMVAEQGTLNLGLVWGCAGNNMAFRRSLFYQVGGYRNIRDQLGGDDSLFMQIVNRKADQRIVFASDPRSWVETKPVGTLAGVIRQRARWAADAKYMVHLNIPFFIVIVSTFISNLMPICYFFTWILGLTNIIPFLILTGLKLVGEGFVAWRGTRVYQRKNLRRDFLQWFVLQMPYVALMGILSFWGNRMTWNRKRMPLGLMENDKHHS